MKKLDQILNWYEEISLKTLDDISLYYVEDAFFKDPFNEVVGRDKIKQIFLDMFDHLENPHFEFIDRIEQGKEVFVTWNFVFSAKKQPYSIHGSSHLKFNDEMTKLTYHRDYWDVGEELLLRIPVIKRLYGFLRKKIGSH